MIWTSSLLIEAGQGLVGWGRSMIYYKYYTIC